MALKIGLPDFTGLDFANVFQFLILFCSSTLFSVALGTILSPLMKSMKPDNAFLLLGVVPFLVLMMSGLYYDSTNQILGFGYIAQILPYTTLGEFLRTGASIQNTAIALTLSLLWYGGSLVLYKYSLRILFLAKRLKD